MHKGCDKTIVERRPHPVHSEQASETGLLSQQELDELGMLALEQIPQPLQPWQTDPSAEYTMESGQRDLLDFLGAGQTVPGLVGGKPEMWIDKNKSVVAQVPQIQPKKEETNWKEDPPAYRP